MEKEGFTLLPELFPFLLCGLASLGSTRGNTFPGKTANFRAMHGYGFEISSFLASQPGYH